MGTLKRIAGPAYLGSSVANVYTPPASTIFTTIRQIHVVNHDSSARTFTLYVGATGGSSGGTEIAKDVSVAVGAYTDLFFSPGLRMADTDFLSGIASAGSALVITVMGTQDVV